MVLTNLPRDPLLDLDPWVGQRSCTFKFHVVDAVSGDEMGEIHPIRGATLSHDTGRTIKRDLNISLGAADTAAINPLRERISVTMVFGNGDTYPMGRYMFTDDSKKKYTSGKLGSEILNDEMFLIDQQIRKGIDGTLGSVSDVIQKVLNGLPITYEIEPSNFSAREVWPIGTNRGSILESLSISGDFFCMVPETRVLCADLIWRPLGHLNVGDELIGFDENVRSGAQRYRRSYVESLNQRYLECFEIETEFGITIASKEHLWLTNRSVPTNTGHKRDWKKTSDLTIGDEILAFGPPWDIEESKDAGYLAGIYDGEGCLALPMGAKPYRSKIPRITFGQNPGVVLDKVMRLLTERNFDFRVDNKTRQKMIYLTHRGGKYETMRFLGSIRPERLLKNADSLWDGRATWSVQGSHKNKVKIISIRSVGVRKVVAIGTSTRTFIADGLLTHNSPWMDNTGIFRMIRTFNPIDRIPDIDLDNGNRVLRESIEETSDLLTAPNMFIVMSNVSGTNGEQQIVGTAQIPVTAPNSVANRGFEIVDSRTLQLASPGQAQAVANGIAQRQTVYERVVLTTPPDPRHDSYNVIHWDNAQWLELSWSMALVEGGTMNHLLRKAYQ